MRALDGGLSASKLDAEIAEFGMDKSWIPNANSLQTVPRDEQTNFLKLFAWEMELNRNQVQLVASESINPSNDQSINLLEFFKQCMRDSRSGLKK